MSRFTRNGILFEVSTPTDDNSDPPWDCECGHGPVYAFKSYRRLNEGEEEIGGGWVYDRFRAKTQAVEEEWGLNDVEMTRLTTDLNRAPTEDEIVERSVDLDIEYLGRYARGVWHYVGVCVRQVTPDGEYLTGEYDYALWGVNSDDEAYIQEVANELADEITGNRLDEFREALHEARERRYWQSRDVATA